MTDKCHIVPTADCEYYDECQRLKADNDRLRSACERMTVSYNQEHAEIDRLRSALRRIADWAKAYPLDIFPEPDFKKAHEVLTANGMTLDAISASNMRHAISGVGEIAESALAEVGR